MIVDSTSHDGAATAIELFQDPWTVLLGRSLEFGVLIVLLLLLMMLAPTVLLTRLRSFLIAPLRIFLVLLLPMIMVSSVARRVAPMLLRDMRWHLRRTSRQIDIYPSRVMLGGVLKTQLLADLLHARFDFLYVVRGVISLSHYPIHPVLSVPGR